MTKGRQNDSVTIGAKVKIGGKDYYELVIVKVTEKNRLYVHEMHMAETGKDAVLYQTRSQKDAIGGHPDPNTETEETTPFWTRIVSQKVLSAVFLSYLFIVYSRN